MKDTARRDYCPDCKYEFYYGDAHAKDPEDRISKVINVGRDCGKDYSVEEVVEEEHWRERGKYMDEADDY